MENEHLHKEKELFTLIAEGDERAFEQLYSLYLSRIQPIILQIVKIEMVAKDIVQDVFLRLWISREKLSDIRDPKSYIFRIVYNQSFKYLKRQRIEEKATTAIASDLSAAGPGVSPEGMLDLAEVRRQIGLAIETLPPQSRQIYRLHRVSGHKPQEIASQMGISVQSVRNSLTRSGKLIREYLEDQGITLPFLLILLALQ